MKIKKKPLIRELKWTMLGLSTAMLAMWFFFYVSIHNLVQHHVMQNMEQVSEQIISEMNRSFLQLEEVSFALSKDQAVQDFILEEDDIAFIQKAGRVEKIVNTLAEDSSLMEHLIVFDAQGRYYRFMGNISNSGLKRLYQIISLDSFGSHIRLFLDETSFIGYVTEIDQDQDRIGTIVMLIDENDIYRLFEQMSENENMKIALAAEGKVILTNDEKLQDAHVADVRKETSYIVYKQVGFTPFELLLSYEDSNHSMSTLFLTAMLVMAALLLILLEIFLRFWKQKFFEPIQSVITEVESFEGGRGEAIPATGMEHFDGLVAGINDMVERIEQKEKEVYETAYSLQEAELKKQKALIISLKKQISAHFTVNVLNIIKALSATGDNEKAGLMCDGLSYLLRYANVGDALISGMEEFFVLQKYTDIMEIRYPGRFVADIDMEDELEEIELPRMLLQPIVENSILHGVIRENSDQKGKVHVYCYIEPEEVCIVIEDDGKGMTATELEQLRNDIMDVNLDEVDVEGLSHVALINIERRIRSYFGKTYGLSIESSEGTGTKVVVRLPVIRRGI